MSNPADDFRHLLNATKIISSSLSLEEQLPSLMDAVVQLSGADKAMLILRGEDGSLQVKAERSANPDASSSKFSATTIEQVFKSGHPLFVLASDLKETEASESMAALHLRTVMCTPLVSPAGVIGVLYADSTTPLKAFDAHKKEIFVALSEHAAVALNNARLFAASITDPMTGLYNHAYYLRRLKEEVERAQRYSRPLSCILLDVDHFKAINDTYGHRKGDDVIRAVADALKACVRTVDVAARYGGDEFAVILPETEEAIANAPAISGSVSGAKLLAERIRIRIGELRVPPVEALSSSLGVATLERGVGMEVLIERADQALYASKRSGRNRVSVYGET